MTRFEALKIKSFMKWKSFMNIVSPVCVHTWRPARSLTGKPVRVCQKCNSWNELSEAEFYAYFGRISK